MTDSRLYTIMLGSILEHELLSTVTNPRCHYEREKTTYSTTTKCPHFDKIYKSFKTHACDACYRLVMCRKIDFNDVSYFWPSVSILERKLFLGQVYF